MNGLCEKIYLEMDPPTEEENKSDRKRILDALTERGLKNIAFSLEVTRKIFPLCRNADWKITVTIAHMERETRVIRIEKGDTTDVHYGMAVDYGSTTIVMQLIDLNRNEVLLQEQEVNGQTRFGDDILTRITYGMQGEEKIRDIQLATVETFQRLADRVCEKAGVSAEDCSSMVISGNTTMVHFLLGLDAQTVFFSPFAPVTTNPGFFTGKELELNFPGIIFIMPSASNYIGGDIISGLITMDFYHKEGLYLFFDVGTNGELVMGNRDWIIAGAGAAGPALEGAISKYGIRACEGAIDTLKIRDGRVCFTTIGNTKPIGICGSGIIDLVAELRLNGWMDISGRLIPENSDCMIYLEDMQEYAVVYAQASESKPGIPLYFSQTDLDQYRNTKAAAHTMVDLMLDYAGCREEDLTGYYLSGAFCNHADMESAITLGMFPDIDRNVFHCIPNSSLDGARTLLTDREKMKEIEYLLDTIYCVQFASLGDFTIRMQAAKFVPHTDMAKYPSVVKRLKDRGIVI